MKNKPIKAWAVWNTELNSPCVFFSEDDKESRGSAIFSEDLYHARKQAIEYLNNFTKKARKDFSIKLVRVLITRI